MSTAVTLYPLEEQLLALIDTADMVDDPEQQEAIARDIVSAHLACVEKRDRVAQFLVHCEGMQASIDLEMKRLGALKKAYSKTQGNVEGHIVHTIESLGENERGRYRKLEGHTTVFAIRACPPSVSVTDETAVPSAYKTLTITVPALAWEAVADSLDIDERTAFLGAVKKSECAVDRKGLKAAIEQGREVPGASLLTGKHSLVRK